jgi:hypothetical protein
MGTGTADDDARTLGPSRIQQQIVETERKLAANKAQLAREFPEYAALANPKPLNTEEVQPLLSADEALVFWLGGEKHRETYVFALTRDGLEWKTIAITTEALQQKVGKS